MEELKFRLLRADEIDVFPKKVTKNGCMLLLYKDARCDMNILDETVGAMNWQRHHETVNGNLFCNVGIFKERQDGFGEWIWKQDVGVESNTEKEKGQASDSFKRACFNWGIGRELYSAPFIWISEKECEIKEINGKYNVFTKFSVKEISYDESRRINRLVIVDAKNGKPVFTFGTKDAKGSAVGLDWLKKNLTEHEMKYVRKSFKVEKDDELQEKDIEMALGNILMIKEKAAKWQEQEQES